MDVGGLRQRHGWDGAGEIDDEVESRVASADECGRGRIGLFHDQGGVNE